MDSDGKLTKEGDNPKNPAYSSSGQLDDSLATKYNLTPELRDKVFGNALIRDHIFDYALSSEDRLYKRSIASCRLVEHAWLDYISQRLQNLSSPLFTVTLNFLPSRNSNEHKETQPYEVVYQKFLDTWVAYPGAGGRIPLFKLVFSRSYDIDNLDNDEVRKLPNILLRCGSGLYSLNLRLFSVDKYDTDIHCAESFENIGQMVFPNLKELDLSFLSLADRSPLIARLLSFILSGCKRLTSLSLRREFFVTQAPLSRLFYENGPLPKPTEQLPNTLKSIKIEGNVTSQLLANLFLENSLTKLTELKLRVSRGADKDVLSRILSRFSHQLKCIMIASRLPPDLSSGFVKFPVMTKLKEMTIEFFYSELEPGIVIEQPFPVLETLHLRKQTSSKIQKWTQNFRFNCVSDLSLIIHTIYSNDNNFTLQLSQQLHLSFPHVRKLSLTVGGSVEDGSMRNIFQHMTQLCELNIHLIYTLDVRDASTWDAILLGVNPEYAKDLAASPRELWDSINLSHHRTPSLSILNLSRLTTLCLSTGRNLGNDLLISDVSFHFAFLRMHNLQTLMLKGRFQASKEMAEEWCRHGRKIV